MAAPGKSITAADSKPADAGRRVVRIPFPPKTNFWKLMVEKGWAVEAESLRKDIVEVPHAPIVPIQPKPVEVFKRLTTSAISSLFDEGKFDDIISLALERPENLSLVIVEAIERIGESSDYEKGLRKGYCMLQDKPHETSRKTNERDEGALYVLDKLGELALPRIRTYLTSESSDVRRMRKLAGYLATSERSSHIQLLMSICDEHKSEYCLLALKQQSNAVMGEIVKALESKRHSQDTEVNLLGILAKLGNSAMLEKYPEYLDTHCEFADELIRQLIDFGEESVPVLSEYLGGRCLNFHNKLHVLYAFERIASPGSLGAAFNLLEAGNSESVQWNQVVTAIKKVVLAVGPESVPHILAHMQNGALTPSPRTYAYLEFLGALKCGESVNALSQVISASQSSTPEAAIIRAKAAETLGEIGLGSAFEPLRGLLGDRYEHVAKSAAIAIDNISHTGALDKRERLCSCLFREVPEQVDYGDDEVYKHLVSSVRYRFPSVRATAVAALGLSGKGDAVPIIISSLRDKHPQVRAAAATALRNNREERAISPLIDALGDENEAVFLAVSSSLIDYHRAMDTQDNDEDIVTKKLISALAHKNKRVRYNAIKLISHIGVSPAIPALKRVALEDPEPNVRCKALKSLSNHASQNINTYIEALGDSESEIAELAIAQLQILEGIGNHAITAALKSNKRPAVRIGASLALARSGNPHFIQNLKNALQDPKKEVRLAAIVNIGELTVRLLETPPERYDDETKARIRSAHVENATIPLMKLLEGNDEDIRAESTSAIARIVNASGVGFAGLGAIPHIVGLLRNESESVRGNVVDLLSVILESCDCEDEVSQYLTSIKHSSDHMRGILGQAADMLWEDKAAATVRAREICEEFVRLAREKKRKYQNGHAGPYR